MNRTSPIYTEKNNCQDCYKCLRQCPVKAIKIEEGSASVIPEECIYCGHCVQVCPAGAKKVRRDLPGLIRLIGSKRKVIACLAPSYVTEFPDANPLNLLKALHELGFFGVSETALGAELVARETVKWIAGQQNGVFISSCCTSLVQIVKRHYPQLAGHLVPVMSPMQAHAKMLKELYGPDVAIAFFGPCIAKKSECDEFPELTDFVLTFADLQEWLATELQDWNKTSMAGKPPFIPYQAGKGSFFPVDGGMIANMKEKATLTETSYMSFSGINNIKEVLNGLANWKTDDKLFLELLICEGGCIKGPGTTVKNSLAVKRQQMINAVKSRRPVKRPESAMPDVLCSPENREAVTVQQLTDKDIADALIASGKFSEADELNCGGCGYDSCRDFAKAMLLGKAERIMCVSYTRKVAQDKASVLLKKIPYGVVVVDENLKVIDSNRKFAELMGSEVSGLYESVGNLDGADLHKMISFHKLFTSVLHTGEEMIEHRVREAGLLLHVSVVTIQPYKIVCGIIQNMQDPEIRKDIVLNSVKQVIHQNMEVVQKIAYLLGENASYTESMLNSIAESTDEDLTDHL